MIRHARHGALSLAAVLMPGLSAHAATPPIDCHRAATQVERQICASPESVAMDQEVTALYNRGMAKLLGEARHRLAQSQVAYVHKRAGCGWAAHHSAHPGVAVEECVTNTMGERLRTLRAVVDRGGF